MKKRVTDNERYLRGLDYLEAKARAWLSVGTTTRKWVRDERYRLRASGRKGGK
jgi:hypothetical protein